MFYISIFIFPIKQIITFKFIYIYLIIFIF
jgi:hypothetical protein